MINKCVDFYSRYKQIILYLIFGALTTLVNIITFYICNDLFVIEYKLSNIIAWVLSVIFAFFTNKTIVFSSKSKDKKHITYEVISFLIARLLSLLFDMALMIFMIEILKIDELITKILVNIFVVIINYLFSKFIIFRK